MNAIADALRGCAVIRDRELPAEFEQQLPELTTLAFRVAYSVLRHRQDAEDVAQEAIARAYQKFSSLRDRAALRAWTVRVAWRRALDHRRTTLRRQRRESVSQAPLAAAAEQATSSNRFREELFEAIERLPAKLRMTILLCAVEGYDTRETAALLQIPEGTVRSRLHLARRRLAEILK